LSINGTLDLRNLMLSQVLGHDNALNTDKVFLTYSLFDQRNQLTKTIQPGMEGWSSTAVIETNAEGQSTVVRQPDAGSVTASSGANTNPINAGSVGIGGGSVNWTMNLVSSGLGAASANPYKVVINILLPLSIINMGNGNTIVEVSLTSRSAGQYGTVTTRTNPPIILNGDTYSTHTEFLLSGGNGFSYDQTQYPPSAQGISIKITKNIGANTTTVINQSWQAVVKPAAYLSPAILSTAGSATIPIKLYFRDQPYIPDNAALSTSNVLLSYRPLGSSNAYTTVSVPKLLDTSGNPIGGVFAFDWSSIPAGEYEYQYLALNNAGEILNAQGGTFNTINASAPTVSPQTPLLTSGAGGAIVTNPTGVITTNAIAHPTFNITLTGNSVKKTGGGNAWGDADAISMESFTGGAYVSAQAGQTNLAGMFGLNADPTANKSYNTLDYAWYPTSTGILQIYENGTHRGDFGTYTTSDILAIEYVGSEVRYLKNGVIMRTVSDVGVDRNFYFDSSFNSVGFSLNNILFGNSAANATDINFNTTAINKVGGNAAWDTDAYSSHFYTNGAYVSAQAGQTNSAGMFGLNSDPTTNKSYDTLDYAWYPTSSGILQIYENGAHKGDFGSYTTSDILAIEYVGTEVRYLKNGAVIRTVDTTANRTFYFDSSFHNHYFTLNNLKFGATAETARSLLINPQGSELNLIGQGAAASSVVLRYRVKESNDAWNTIPASNFIQDGFFGVGSFTLPTNALGIFVNGVEYDIEVDVRDASNNLIRTSTGSLSRDVAGNLSVGALTVPPTLTFHQGEASSLKIRYRVAGSTDNYSEPITLSAGSNGQFDWNPAALVPDWNSTYAYEFDIQAYDANGWLIRHNRTDITLGSPITIGTTQALSVTSLTVTP
ncbi:hypothetical protein LG198_11110, partial [Methylobacillus arboreus]|uniref:hypothetical protein n=1 Tax=Methylobacillus arboreus TaxID=755170 RepID=UPI001E6525EB